MAFIPLKKRGQEENVDLIQVPLERCHKDGKKARLDKLSIAYPEVGKEIA